MECFWFLCFFVVFFLGFVGFVVGFFGFLFFGFLAGFWGFFFVFVSLNTVYLSDCWLFSCPLLTPGNNFFYAFPFWDFYYLLTCAGCTSVSRPKREGES